MSDKLDLNFLKKVQGTMEPSIFPGETAIEYLKRTEAEKMASIHQRHVVSAPQTPAASQMHPPTAPTAEKPQEVVFVEGHRLSRDFFTCVAVSLLKTGDPVIQQTFEAFGFQMKDLDGKPIVFKKKKRKS